MTKTGREQIDDLANEHRAAGRLLGYSVDDDEGVVQFFVPDDLPLPELPRNVGHYDVVVVPLPRPEKA